MSRSWQHNVVGLEDEKQREAHTKWAGKKLRRPDFPNYVENHCREWCASADTSYRLLAAQKLNRKNLESQIATIRPLRQRAKDLEILELRELETYFRL
jgi:hypothetical protein